MNMVQECSTTYAYTLKEYFSGDYETYKVMYEKFVELYDANLIPD